MVISPASRPRALTRGDGRGAGRPPVDRGGRGSRCPSGWAAGAGHRRRPEPLPPPNFGSEVLARELGLVRNHRRDEPERSRGEPVRLGLAAMVDRARRPPTRPPQAGPLPRHPAAVDERRAPPPSCAWRSRRWASRTSGAARPSPASPRGPQGPRGFDCSGSGLVGVHRRLAAPRGGARGGPARPDHGGRSSGAAARAGPDRRARTPRPRLFRRPRPPVAARDHLLQRDRPRQRLDGPRLGPRGGVSVSHLEDQPARGARPSAGGVSELGPA